MRLSCYLKAKIHHAVITDLRPDYIGSIAIGNDLMKLCGISNGEQVHVWGVESYVWCPSLELKQPSRIITYAFEGPEGKIAINGGGAEWFGLQQKIIIAAFDLADRPIDPIMIKVNENNKLEDYLTFQDIK